MKDLGNAVAQMRVQTMTFTNDGIEVRSLS